MCFLLKNVTSGLFSKILFNFINANFKWLAVILLAMISKIFNCQFQNFISKNSKISLKSCFSKQNLSNLSTRIEIYISICIYWKKVYQLPYYERIKSLFNLHVHLHLYIHTHVHTTSTITRLVSSFCETEFGPDKPCSRRTSEEAECACMSLLIKGSLTDLSNRRTLWHVTYSYSVFNFSSESRMVSEIDEKIRSVIFKI